MALKIVIIKIDYRSKRVPEVQNILTNFGCDIKVRVGFHEAADDFCSEQGVIILQLLKNEKELIQELNEIDGVNAALLDI
ncbi:MAG: hypothetical protein BGN88_03400 [Clostridiales bacterium 43-6]|nr:MAG: hypothetical protein BGN88_03400 [Clostridiales bacterium 43-6]